MLIGFAGKRTAGKTTAAQILIKEYGFKQAKFAAALKEAARVAYGLTHEQTDGDQKEVPTDKLGGKTPRDAMEWLGEDSRKRYGEAVWVKRWFEMHADALGKVNFVFDDVRNPIEADAIRQHGGVVIRVFNPRADALDMMPSETEIDNIRPDYILANNRTPRFADDVRALMVSDELIKRVRDAA